MTGFLPPDDWNQFKDLSRKNGTMIEEVMRSFYQEILNKNDSAIDGGAHLGYHTFPLAEVVTDGTVYAVEADETTFARLLTLREKRKLNNIKAIRAALQNDPNKKSGTFLSSPTHPGRSGLNPIWIGRKNDVEYEDQARTPLTTIDKLGATNVAFIKLDLEGSEFRALRGADETIRRDRPVIVCEHSNSQPTNEGFTAQEWLDYFKDRSYTAYSPNGEKLTADEFFPYWYVWILPDENKNEHLTALKNSLTARHNMSDRSLPI